MIPATALGSRFMGTLQRLRGPPTFCFKFEGGIPGTTEHQKDASMDEDALEQLRAQIWEPLVGDKVSVDKRLKAEILQMRSHASIVEEKPGNFVCEAVHGRAVVVHKEATLFEPVALKAVRCQSYKSHLFAVHSALCWAVLGVSIG